MRSSWRKLDRGRSWCKACRNLNAGSYSTRPRFNGRNEAQISTLGHYPENQTHSSLEAFGSAESTPVGNSACGTYAHRTFTEDALETFLLDTSNLKRMVCLRPYCQHKQRAQSSEHLGTWVEPWTMIWWVRIVRELAHRCQYALEEQGREYRCKPWITDDSISSRLM